MLINRMFFCCFFLFFFFVVFGFFKESSSAYKSRYFMVIQSIVTTFYKSIQTYTRCTWILISDDEPGDTLDYDAVIVLD